MRQLTLSYLGHLFNQAFSIRHPGQSASSPAIVFRFQRTLRPYSDTLLKIERPHGRSGQTLLTHQLCHPVQQILHLPLLVVEAELRLKQRLLLLHQFVHLQNGSGLHQGKKLSVTKFLFKILADTVF